jgi:iron complex transport system substrate-binding protein
MPKLRFITVLLIVAVCLAGCGVAAPASPTAEPPQPTATLVPPTPTPALFPLSLTDGLGREVTLPDFPQRIVSLAPSNTEILFAIGAGGAVVGVTEYCDYPSAAQQVEKIGGFSAKTISVEKIVSLEPDLVLAYGSRQQTVIEALERVNVPVYALAPNSFDDVYANIQTVGRMAGHEAEADQIVTEMQARIDTVVGQVAAIPQEERLSIFWEIFDEPLMTAGPATFAGQMIELAGGVNIFAGVAEDYPQISAEEIIARNPAAILGSDTHGDKLTPEQVAARPGWDRIDAVKNGRVHLIDGNIVSRAGPRLAEAVEAIARALYPEMFP